MANNTKVTLSKGGTEKKILSISQIDIPDLWHIAETIGANGKIADGPKCAELILECWSRAHDFKRHIQES